MRAIDILWYLLGREDAIRRVASNRSAWIAGLLLVLMAGIAREYDQTYIPHFGTRFLFPVISSFIAAAVIYGCLTGFILPKASPDNEAENEKKPGGFLCFLSLFWMTAPFAWVYAYPAEHLFPPREAAWINIGLLIFVATARVLLLSRVLSVLYEISFLRTLSSVLLISSVIMGFGSISTSLSLVQMMGGLRYSPEEQVLRHAAGVALGLSIGGFCFFGIVCMILANVKMESRKCLPEPSQSGIPVVFLSLAMAAWFFVLVPQQNKLALNHQALWLMQQKDYAGMLAFLSKHSPDDFNKVHRLPPDPYEYWGLAVLPEVIVGLNDKSAPWVREMYLDYLGVALQHYHVRSSHPFLISFESILRLPEGEGWIRAHSVEIESFFQHQYAYEFTPESRQIADKLKALGLKIVVPDPPAEPKP